MCARDRQVIAKPEMTMRCKGVVGREVGVKSCGVQRVLCLCGPGVGSCQSMV